MYTNLHIGFDSAVWVAAIRCTMHHQSEEDEDSLYYNNGKSEVLSTESAGDIPNLRMSGHSINRHSFSRKSTTHNLLNIDSDDNSPTTNNENLKFTSNSNSPSKNSDYLETMIQKHSANINRIPSGGPSSHLIKSPKAEENQESLSDSDESDELGVIKKKKVVLPGEYDSTQYEHLEINDEIKEIFQYIIKYIPQQLNLDFKLKPFIPEFIPAVGDIDAFLKIIPPEKTLSNEMYTANSKLGLTVLDEPAANQSDPALLHLQLRATSISVSHVNEAMVVKKVDNVDKNIKTVDKWVKDVSELHRNKATSLVKYTSPMPDLDDLMQEWPEKFENIVKLQGIPNSIFSGSLSQYVGVICSVFDIPVYKNKVQSLHLLFSLYAAIKNSQFYGSANTLDIRDNNDADLVTKTDRLILD